MKHGFQNEPFQLNYLKFVIFQMKHPVCVELSVQDMLLRLVFVYILKYVECLPICLVIAVMLLKSEHV